MRGALPPLTAAAWESLFALYQESGEYRAAPLALEDFRAIFWWEAGSSLASGDAPSRCSSLACGSGFGAAAS